MAKGRFTWLEFFARVLLALVLVFATYNPTGYSYFGWAIAELPAFGAPQAFAGVVLLIGWTIFIRATSRSLGAFGAILALAFFGTLFWLVTQWGLIPTDSVKAVTYIALVIVGAVLGTGISWSHIRRRLSGQADVDPVEEDL